MAGSAPGLTIWLDSSPILGCAYRAELTHSLTMRGPMGGKTPQMSRSFALTSGICPCATWRLRPRGWRICGLSTWLALGAPATGLEPLKRDIFTPRQQRSLRRFYLRLLLGAYLGLPGKDVGVSKPIAASPAWTERARQTQA